MFILLVLAIAMALGTVLMVWHDGRGPAAPPRSHFTDPMFRSTAAG